MVMRVARASWWVLRKAIRVLWVSTMVLVPLFGFWLASSLAAYHNASQWLALVVGLALFPLVPVGWDLVFLWRRRHDERPRVLTRLDRLVLRTLIVDGLFLGVMLYAAPHAAFRAVAVRGDWMLDDYDGPAVARVRDGLLWVADTLEQRWHDRDAAYGDSDQAPEPGPAPDRKPTDWPLPAAVDAEVRDIPESAQTSVDAVGKYFAARITEPRRLVKALHDYVDLRLTYDHKALDKINQHDFASVPSQEAEPVFAARTGVCAGYAHLLAALGKSAGVEIAFVTGYARDSQQRAAQTGGDAALVASLSGYEHAWNAARIDGQWSLIDATWDDSDGDNPIRSTYLFTPPALFAYDHLPTQSNWQLLDHKLTLGEFVRQPLLTPVAGAFGLALVDPARSQVTVDRHELEVTIDNPQHAALTAEVSGDGGKRCEPSVTTDARATLTCRIGSGQLEVRLFAGRGPDKTGTSHYDYVGAIQVNAK